MNNKANRVGIGALAVAAAAFSGVGLTTTNEAQAQATPEVTIKDIKLRGAGCPEGSATAERLDATSFAVFYDAFSISAGPGIPPEQNIANCTAIITLEVPQGWTWTVTSIDYSGSARLDDGVYGRMSARLSFPGQRPVSEQVVLPGPTSPGGQDFDLPAQFDLLTWSRCGSEAPMLALATIQVDNSADRTRSGTVQVAQQTGDFALQFHVGWRRC